MRNLLAEFLASEDNLRVYKEGKPIFASRKEGLLPLLDYISRFRPRVEAVTVFDRIVGNAAALLLKAASCAEVYSPVGSRSAARTLRKYGIAYYFGQTVPRILNSQGDAPCPMERLSRGKTPEEFYQLLISVRGAGDGRGLCGGNRRSHPALRQD